LRLVDGAFRRAGGASRRTGGAIAAPGGSERISIRAPALPSASLARATVARAAGAHR
jgi:hypothetical protein